MTHYFQRATRPPHACRCFARLSYISFASASDKVYGRLTNALESTRNLRSEMIDGRNKAVESNQHPVYRRIPRATPISAWLRFASGSTWPNTASSQRETCLVPL